MKMSGIIFSNIYDSTMGELTAHRTMASVPFGGRYRFVDFVLSNMVNSNINHIGIITKYNYQSLMDHIGSGVEWDLGGKNSNLYILPPFGTGVTNVYRGNLEALSNAVTFLNATKPDYVLMCDATVICSIDYELALKSHIDSGADVTVIANDKIDSYECGDSDFVVNADENGTVTDLAIGYMLDGKPLVGMGMFIIGRKALINIINNYVSRGRYSFEKDYLLTRFNDDSIKINAYKFGGAVLRNHNTVAYFKNNFKLMDESIRKDIFKPDAPIHTKVRDEAPSYYHDGSSVSNALVADGCNIHGKVENSILFRDVVVEKGAIVRNSIVMQGSRIGAGSTIDYAIIDKNVTISPSAILKGASSVPVVVRKGETV